MKSKMAEATYTGEEDPIDLKETAPVESDEIFEVRPSDIPTNAVPIYDESLHAIVGYRHESTVGVYRLYDLYGKQVGMEEEPLESPLIDPLDFIFVFGGLFRCVGKGGIRLGTRMAVTTGTRLTARSIGAAAVTVMRAAFRNVSIRSLKFTATTAPHMASKGRYVPLHILNLAIKYGKRGPDPQGVKGAFQYMVPMWRNGKRYIIEIVVREKDWTILHFEYK